MKKVIRPENDTFDYQIMVNEQSRPYSVHKMKKHRVRGKWFKELRLWLREVFSND